MNLQEKLQQLALERQNLQIAMYEVNGAMKLLEQQILEAEPEAVQPSDTEASTPVEEATPST
ncbi:hypothetical protein [uncultured Mediterranean phage uvMED]|nr:hypothetical protein [uncultured Mediterranean phage uvMED]